MAKADNFFGATDTGRQRSNNEDSFIAQLLPDGRVLACVIDGVGGYEGGEVAAALARETIIQEFEKPQGDAVQKLKTSFVRANDRIYEDRFQNPDRSSMACVVTALVADSGTNQLHYAHVGDTRLYLLRDESLIKLTKDHSFVGFLEDNKRISEVEAMQHPKRNEINKALGYDPNMARVADYIETGVSPFLPGDLLMLCSDGLTDLVDATAMTSVLVSTGSLKDKTQLLIQAANDAGGKDNITVVLVQNSNKAVKQKKTKPVLVKKNETAPKPQAENRTVTPAPVFKKRNNTFTIILLLLFLVLGAAVYYLWNENKELASSNDGPAAIVRQQSRNAGEQRLLDSLEISPFLFLDSSYGSTIIISDTIPVQKDSLYINGNGVVLQSDTSYTGPLLVAGNNSGYIALENLVIENFDIGLIAQTKMLRLKNVVFRNCRIPVQHAFHIPADRPVSGVVIDSVLFKPDSLPK